MKSFFTELFEYNHHYNQLLVQVFQENTEKTTERLSRLFCHVLNAHQTWNSRIQGVSPTLGIWEELPVSKLRALDQANLKASLLILGHQELQETIHYKTSRGEAFSNSIRDILFHIINHSTYHRGQIATDLRKIGIEPVVTDYIFYKRQS